MRNRIVSDRHTHTLRLVTSNHCKL